ncbi:hypothetical protein Leryth_020488 [Lithospermum erythrorhizon]|nr:hypothetical protein Leryth_020488 [Lithospermum erythrorhizon]
MVSQPKPAIQHFTHQAHPLKEFNSESEYLCDGCKTSGAGKRYRCHGCDFDMHEYCGTCPEKLSIFMHRHELSLVIRKVPIDRPLNNRTCDVCHDSVKGLFYRCKDCDFDVHPLCTQLPQSLRHGLHQAHSLKLESSSTKGNCAVCTGECSSWRYRCKTCRFDIHLDCVLVDIRPKTSQESHRGIPNFVPPHHHPQPPFGTGYMPPPAYGYYPNGGFPYGFPHPPHPPGQFYHQEWVAQPHPNHVAGGTSSGGGLGKKMFGLVGQLGMGVVSNALFGVDITSFF